MIEQELASPTDAMRTSFRALEPEHRELLISLLDAPAGLIDERELAAVVRRHHPGGLSLPVGELIDRLTDHFLRVTPLGIGWVHPSWRDLVIDELRGDPDARQRFLCASAVDGVTLAVSHAGGSAGERTLPLMIADADWDALGDRLHELRRELEDRELARVLLALGGALDAVDDLASGQRARQPGGERARRDPPRVGRAAPAGAGVPARGVARAERERRRAGRRIRGCRPLGPSCILVICCSSTRIPSELARTDEWLALAEMLSRYDPVALEELDFYGRDRELLERLIVTLTRTCADEDLRPLAESVLARIERVVPDLASGAQSAREIGRLVERLGRRRWWVPEDIAAPPSVEPASASATQFNRADVASVLRDL